MLVTLHTVRAKLDQGDYSLEGSDTLIERKGTLAEIHHNCCSHDRPRFLRALKRLADACRHPAILVEHDWPPADKEHVLGLDALFRLTVPLGISVLLLPTKTENQRRAAGEICARMLVAGLPSCQCLELSTENPQNPAHTFPAGAIPT